MDQQPEPAPDRGDEEKAKSYPWYSLDPRAIRRSRLLHAVLIALVVTNFQVAPVWRLLWYHNIPNRISGLVYARGLPKGASRWFEGKTIRVYQLPYLERGKAKLAAAGVRELLEDAGLDFRVEVRPMSERMMDAYERCADMTSVSDGEEPRLDRRKLEREFAALRGEDQHADVLVVNVLLSDAEWASGEASPFSGVAVLDVETLSKGLAKHEACHLMGYSLHDRMPLFVFGYGWEGWPWERETLMGSVSFSDDLSPRARDALRSYWRGMEKRTGQRFLSPE